MKTNLFKMLRPTQNGYRIKAVHDNIAASI